MRGFNLTMPCKNDVISYIDELSPAARLIGAVNTVINENGRLIGYNTDGMGFVNNLKAHKINIKNKKIVVAGAGGAATAIIVQLALDGAREICIFNKKSESFSRMLETIERIKKEVPDVVINIHDILDEAKYIETIKLLREACEAGCICIDGKGMLLWQGVYAFKLYTGKDMPVEEVRNKFF